MKIVLASQSKYRQKILREAGYQFEAMPADLDEKSIRHDDWHMLPLILARAKAHSIADKIHEPAIIISSDLIVVCNGELREKPENEKQSEEFLISYGKYPAEGHAAVYVINTENGKSAESIDIEKVYFKPIPNDQIRKIIDDQKIFNAAGGFILEDPLFTPYVLKREGEIGSLQGFSINTVNRLVKVVSD